MDALSFIQKLASDGGAIVCSNECAEMEIVNAVTTDRFYVDERIAEYSRKCFESWREANEAEFQKSIYEDW